MDELQQAIVRARDSGRTWGRDNARRVLQSMTTCLPGTQYDWDEGNESWGMVFTPGHAVAYVSARLPLILVLQKHRHDVEGCVANAGAVLFSAEDFDESKFCVDRALLDQIFGGSRTPNVCYDKLSINDLWYATIS
jgi:hypothetical protein